MEMVEDPLLHGIVLFVVDLRMLPTVTNDEFVDDAEPWDC